MTRLLACLALAGALTGCQDDRRRGERLVRAYNDAAITAYRTGNFTPIKQVASEKEWGRVVVLVDLKTAARLVLESELQALEVTSAERTAEGHLKVGTRERWRYWDRPLTPGAPAGRVFVADMTLSYDFLGEADGWKLAGATTLTNEYLASDGGP